jgi:F-type H+-transporting ATPase subunit gamma
MSTIRNTKNRIKSVQTTAKVTKAMKMIASMRLKKFAAKANQAQKYGDELYNSLQKVLSTIPDGTFPEILKGNPNGKDLIVIVAPSRGFCGGLHRTVVAETIKNLAQANIDIQNVAKVEIITINRPAKRILAKIGCNIKASFDGPFKEVSSFSVLPISELVSHLWASGQYKSIFLNFAKSNSAFRATTVTQQVLPIVKTDPTNQISTVNIDSDQDKLISEVLPQIMQAQIYLALLLTQTAEEGARMIAMSQATDNAKELEKKLQLVYFRQRQAKITQEIAEIVGGSI